jgi:hypothetical protein
MRKLPTPAPITPKQAAMQSDMAKYKGKQSNFRTARPVRKVVNRYK